MYEQRSQSQTKAFTFGSKNKESYNQNPGPGAYNAINDPTKDSTRTYVMSTEKRQTNFGNSKDELASPGPGMYERNDSSPVKSFTIAGKNKDTYNQNPGPGAYNANPDHTKDSTRTYAMGSEKRTLLGGNNKEDQPGPGMYELND